MKIKPMIGEYEVPGLERIGAQEHRRLHEIPVPGLAGSYHQDLGSHPLACRATTIATASWIRSAGYSPAASR